VEPSVIAGSVLIAKYDTLFRHNLNTYFDYTELGMFVLPLVHHRISGAKVEVCILVQPQATWDALVMANILNFLHGNGVMLNMIGQIVAQDSSRQH